MKQLVAQFPQQITEAIEIARKSSFPSLQGKNISSVVICGMGGSGIGGKIVQQLFEYESNIPIILVQSYRIPAFVDENTLVIGSSYSGSTEETLSAVEQAIEKGATIVGITSGGQLKELCDEKGYDIVELPGGNPPRSMLAYSLIQIVNILSSFGAISGQALNEFEESIQLIQNELPTIQSEAQKLAKLFHKKQGIIYSDTMREALTIRARQQFNENSKQLVWHHVIPEMNHNELVGWGGGNDHYAVAFLVSQFISERNAKRTGLCREIIEKHTSNTLEIQGKGKTFIQEYFYFIHLVDWASVYLAELNEKDPVEVNVIDYLKSSLKEL